VQTAESRKLLWGVMLEKRINKRYDIRCRVVYSTAGEPNRHFSVLGEDISLGGIGVAIPKFIEEDGILNLRIYGPTRKRPILARGRIIWQGCHAGSIEKRAGIKFVTHPWRQLRQLITRSIKSMFLLPI